MRTFGPLVRHSSESWNPSGLRIPRRRRLDPSLRWGDEYGFTLVELMVELVIIALLATIVILNVRPALDRASKTKATADIAQIEQAIDLYYLDNQRYPTTDEGIQVLVTDRRLRRAQNDPWGRPYRYSAPGRNGQPFTVATWGADGREGGSGNDADITN